jgi:hypothetical protein
MRVTVSPSKVGWLVRIARAARPLQYRYASQSQARFFAAVFRLRPRFFPTAHRLTKSARLRPHN